MARTGDFCINPNRVLLWENTRKEVREALKRSDLKAAIVPTGSTEQHNEHLALCTDSALATLVSQQAALRLYPQVIVSTPCPVGYSPYHMARKGTLSLRRETLKAFVFDVIESLTVHGIGTILVVNGHAGNHAPITDALPQWREKLGIALDCVMYMQGWTEEDQAKYIQSFRALKAGTLDEVSRSALSHASETETALLMAAHSERVKRTTMEEYAEADLDYDESNLSSEILDYYKRHFGEDGYKQRLRAENNRRDRARQEQALLATAESGEALISLATEFVAGRMQDMIDTTENGLPWPPAQ